MKKSILIVTLILLFAQIAAAQGIKFSAGAFGGVSVPIVQEDQGQGTVFGLMARFNAMSIFVIEPNLSFGKWGEPDPIDGFDLGIDGSKVTSFGVNVLLGGQPGNPGIKPYFLGGFSYFKVSNDDTNFDESELGFAVGLGLSVSFMPELDLDLRARGIVIPVSDGSKKAVEVTVGALYNFGFGK